ncbi:MAG: DUF2306 domain-containing protein [Congregibacter sp.]
MNTSSSYQPGQLTPHQSVIIDSKNTMRWLVRLWFSLAALGHWIFVAYIVSAFYLPITQHGLIAMADTHLPSGYREGELFGNLVIAAHVLVAAIVIGVGPLQLVPALRDKYPRVHRYLGRSYLIAAVIGATGGLWVTWTRGAVGNVFNDLGVSLDAFLILLCARFALKYAFAREIAVHRRWAMRLFMVASAVWFFRVGLMGWVMSTGGVGMDFDTFTGPALYVLGIAQFALPLAMLEWYFRCQRLSGGAERWAFNATLLGLTVFMTLGIFAATLGMWFPST